MSTTWRLLKFQGKLQGPRRRSRTGREPGRRARTRRSGVGGSGQRMSRSAMPVGTPSLRSAAPTRTWVWPKSLQALLRSTPIANMEAATNTPGGCGARPGISPSSRARPGSYQAVSKV